MANERSTTVGHCCGRFTSKSNRCYSCSTEKPSGTNYTIRTKSNGTGRGMFVSISTSKQKAKLKFHQLFTGAAAAAKNPNRKSYRCSSVRIHIQSGRRARYSFNRIRCNFTADYWFVHKRQHFSRLVNSIRTFYWWFFLKKCASSIPTDLNETDGTSLRFVHFSFCINL